MKTQHNMRNHYKGTTCLIYGVHYVSKSKNIFKMERHRKKAELVQTFSMQEQPVC